jgi:prepilin-type N-terminal cleavage/methylation domain-containing protein
MNTSPHTPTKLRRALARRLERPSEGEAGFTLVELIIVMQILAIAIAVAVPDYLGLKGRANKRAASADVRNAIPTAELYYVDPTKGALTYKNMTLPVLQAMDAGIKLDAVVVSTDFTTYCLHMTVGAYKSLVVRGLRPTNFGAVQEDVPGTCPAASAL